MFITPALAQGLTEAGTEVADQGSIITSMMPLALILLVFYFMVFRPQSKRIQAHRDLVDNLKKGDRIVTSGGLIGKIYKLTGDDEVVIELADGIRVHAVRSTITTMREKAVSNKEDVVSSKVENDNVKKTTSKKATTKATTSKKDISVSKARGTSKKKA